MHAGCRWNNLDACTQDADGTPVKFDTSLVLDEVRTHVAPVHLGASHWEDESVPAAKPSIAYND
eukprot:scaffold6424_cov17-Tisochrysis_lutea.AAC.2